MSLIITGLNVHTEKGILPGTSVVVSNEKIQSIAPMTEVQSTEEDEVISYPDEYHLIPGFIDLHVHGVNGCDVMDASSESLQTMSKSLAMEGTTAFLATTMTAHADSIEKALISVRNFMDQKQEMQGAAILGVHLEGPFVSSKKAGAQRADQTLMPDVTLLEHWQQKTGQVIKLVTLAPELANSVSFIRYLNENQIIAALGHSDATYAETMAAMGEGISYVTHLFNAMRAIHQREPGAVVAALLSEQVMTEIIVDGHHLHPAIVQLILKLKTKEKIVLVTDAMRAKCLGDGTYDLGGQEVIVKEGVATLADGTLAGSTLKLPVAIQNMMRVTSCSLTDVLLMVSENPAKVLGIFDRKGSIAIGKDADLVVLDDQLNVVLTVCQGQVVYRK